MRVAALMICLSLALSYVVRADQPTTPTPEASPTSAAAPVAATAASSAVVSAAPGASVPPTAADPPAVEKSPAQLKREAAEAKIKQTGAYGYKPETTKAGEVFYCKRETPIGTHFETKQCRTFEQLRDEALRGKEYLEQMQHIVPPNKL